MSMKKSAFQNENKNEKNLQKDLLENSAISLTKGTTRTIVEEQSVAQRVYPTTK